MDAPALGFEGEGGGLEDEPGCIIILIGVKDRSEFVQEEIEILTALTCVVFASSHVALFVLCRICKVERQGSLSFQSQS